MFVRLATVLSRPVKEDCRVLLLQSKAKLVDGGGRHGRAPTQSQGSLTSEREQRKARRAVYCRLLLAFFRCHVSVVPH